MIDALTAVLRGALDALGSDTEFHAWALVGDARPHGLRRMADVAHTVLIPAGWDRLRPMTWKQVRDPDGTDPPLRRLLTSHTADQQVTIEITPADTITITLYDVSADGDMTLLGTRALPVDPVTWRALSPNARGDL